MDHETTPFIRRCRRILLMVHELHKLGYQRLRIAPGMSPSGAYWRCSVTHVANILRAHGAMIREFDREAAHYSSGQDNEYFGWKDTHQDNARQLAVKFVDRFPVIARLGHGTDWLYTGWYVQMLGFAERGDLPVAYADWYSEPDPKFLPTMSGFDSGLPMPPAGEENGNDGKR